MSHEEKARATLERLQDECSAIGQKAQIARKAYSKSRSQARLRAFHEADRKFAEAIERCDLAHEALEEAIALD